MPSEDRKSEVIATTDGSTMRYSGDAVEAASSRGERPGLELTRLFIERRMAVTLSVPIEDLIAIEEAPLDTPLAGQPQERLDLAAEIGEAAIEELLAHRAELRDRDD